MVIFFLIVDMFENFVDCLWVGKVDNEINGCDVCRFGGCWSEVL